MATSRLAGIFDSTSNSAYARRIAVTYWLTFWLTLSLLAVGDAQSQPPTATAPTRTPREERTLDYWAEQLSHERYLRRESAQRHLVAGGQAAVPILRKALQQGDLEITQSAISILAKIAAQEQPWKTDGALAALESIAESSFGSKATLAQSTLTSFAESRGREARVQLAAAGVYLGTEIVAFGSRSRERPIARIDDQWDGNVDSLAWFRWLGDISFVVVDGAAATPDVFQAIVKMPDLTTLVLVDCELTVPMIESLQQRKQINEMELRYVRLNDTLLDALVKVRLRESLYLMGTGVTADRVERLRVQLPGLEITHRLGGFLGVVCTTTLEDYCQVNEVRPDSGAALAGLQSGDVIIQIDDVKIRRFDDLQRQISTHVPGDEIAIRFRRESQVLDTSAKLGKLEDL
ncbi:PDZ domain-containing protein [Stieleria sp. TO1_6]|uniref:PDZ domain-containing protein n=1 Tax=Stieleria tagensis TaxID=2956795 RepID=UPI00209B02E7|nr:PDZ domain-containing protein [Stieleria tagensis]MCO8124841.1 PDZ domain-containing protein [Stieleria tagensis]